MNPTYLLAALVLLLANGFFVSAEFALMSVRRTRLQQLAGEGNTRASIALKSIRELSFMLAGAQLGITMASLGLGYVAEPAVASVIESALERFVTLPAGVLHSISFVIALMIVVFLHMVIGEMAPKNVAIAEPERSALWLAVPIRVYANVFRPVIWILNGIANQGLRLLKVEPLSELIAAHTPGELGAMIAESAREGLLEEFEERLLSGAIKLGEKDAGSIMVARTDMTAASIDATPQDIERLVLETGHSRYPVYTESIDHVVGFFHTKDLLRIPEEEKQKPIPRRLIRQILVVPESAKLRPLLIEMRRKRNHLALVIEEHGGTAGIVTMEDVLEELVGEIQDEYDVAELGVERLGEGRFLAPGTLHLDEAAGRLGVELPPGEYETIAGFLMDRLGRIPKRLDVVEHPPWRLKVRTMYRRKVVQVLIEPMETTGAGVPGGGPD